MLPWPLALACSWCRLGVGSAVRVPWHHLHLGTGVCDTFGHLKRNVWATWAAIQKQYGKLDCASSVWLLLRIYTDCVPLSSSMAVKFGGLTPCPRLPSRPGKLLLAPISKCLGNYVQLVFLFPLPSCFRKRPVTLSVMPDYCQLFAHKKNSGILQGCSLA